MSLATRDIMQRDVHVVDPNASLADLDRELLRRRVGGLPVVEGGRLVGIVSRSDIVRQLGVEQTLAENLSDYHRELLSWETPPSETLHEIADRVGERIEHLRVRDVMSTNPICVSPGTPLDELARVLLEHRIHRLPVLEGERLVGIVTSTDLLRLFAEKRVAPA